MWQKIANNSLRTLLFIGGLSLLLAVATPDNKYFEIAKNLDIFATLFKEVNAFYVDEVDPKKTIETGINAMLASLDPYTNYIPEEEAADYRTMTTGEYAGIGSLIGVIDGKVIITMPNEGFPAEKAGIKIGDQLVKIDDTPVTTTSTSDVSKLLKGKPGTTVNIEVLRNGETKHFTITRSTIVLKNVPYYGMVTDNIGYLKLTEFTTNAGKEVKKAVKKLKSKGATSIILDIRGNPGGLLFEAVNISNVFIPKGNLVVETRGKQEDWTQEYKTLGSATDTEIPLVVLTSSGSASASEIVSGTLQDYDRAVLIGRKTFGKGLVQTTRQLPYNAQVKVTTAKYYIPSGRCIQALDYSHRNADGSVGKVPDSLMVAFKTKKGRTVYDGGGITPDIKVEGQYLAPITINLLTKGHIFNYANQYFYAHPTSPQLEGFNLSDAEYNEFAAWLKGKNYDYTTKLENAITKIEENKGNDPMVDKIKDKLEILKKEVAHNKEKDLQTHKEEIRSLLEEEIMGRYYFTKGEIACSITHDSDVDEAIALLNNPVKYNSILEKKQP
ncbi:MAG: S41 family peptidase [Cyclobacteriaceae bacterium]|nr:S41 family peptidase [Cyclobacteriaceae bacterium]